MKSQVPNKRGLCQPSIRPSTTCGVYAQETLGEADRAQFEVKYCGVQVQAVVTMLPFGAPLAHVLDAPIIQFSPTGDIWAIFISLLTTTFKFAH